jgi:hypothetical protein
MKKKSSAWTRRIFIVAFLVLTFFCWCPILYGSYGLADRILGVPSWAVLAAVFGIVLFVLEWIYLFVTGITMTDEDLPDMISKLSEVKTDASVSPKEDE